MCGRFINLNKIQNLQKIFETEKLNSIQETLRTKFDCSWRNILTITGNEEIERKRSKNTNRAQNQRNCYT